MLAHRVGAIAAIVAVTVLSLELAGAIAWTHHAAARLERSVGAAVQRDAEPSALEAVSAKIGQFADETRRMNEQVLADTRALDSTLEQVTVSERDAR